MKNILLLSMIALFSSCNFVAKVTEKQEQELKNISVVPLMGTRKVNSLSDFELCKNYHRNDTLFLELLESGKVISYPYSALKEEYLESVKNYKVSMIARGWKRKYIPAVIEPSAFIAPAFKCVSEEDRREYRLISILKDSTEILTDSGFYYYAYLPLYLKGFPKPADGILYRDEFFFSEESLKPEITTDFFPGGNYSVVSDYNGKLQLCQMKFDKENDEILLRLEDGKTYRYPAALVYFAFRDQVVQEKIAACITPYGHWFPVGLSDDFDNGYKPHRLALDSEYLLGGGWKKVKIVNARNYLLSKGIAETGIGPKKYFFTSEEKAYRAPKDDLSMEGPVYRGSVDDLGLIAMEILNYGGRLEGSFYFEAEQKRYELSGYTNMDEENPDVTEDDITLTAYRNGEKVGKFEGKLISEKSFAGTWKPYDSLKRYEFKVALN